MSEIVERAADAVRARLGGDFPKTALVLGSGLGRFAEKLESAQAISYAEIPGFSASTVAGHSGKLIVGTLAGKSLAVMAGRIHPYEGQSPEAIAIPIRTLRKLGVERLILTNAAGGLRRELVAGTLVIIDDHINFSGTNPLIGPNDDRIGPRFVDMSEAYDQELRKRLAAAAAQAGVEVKSGVYLFTTGPNFETPAEIRMFARLGADLVGMSTVPEVLAARHCGMRVAALSVVTNLAAGIGDEPLTHQGTLAEATKAYDKVARLLKAFFADL